MKVPMGLLLLSTGVGAAQLQAQSQCYALQYGCSTGTAHTASGSGASIGAPQHVSCNICPGESIFDCHDECAASFAGVTGEAYRAIVEAATTADVRTLLALAPLAAGSVVYNATRKALEVMDCRQASVIASLPIPDADRIAVLAGLNRATAPVAPVHTVDLARWH
ncbi:MAG: hypothetical protein IT361_13950 [Gemmatimonadaceae bacterium]|nr:hypothetical protein [Gemmatimonadaceae bacterium]